MPQELNKPDVSQSRRNFLWLAVWILIGGFCCVAMLLPNLQRGRRCGFPEGTAIGRLRTIATSQAQFQSQVQVDQNKNDTGEYGLLNELCGASYRRDAQGGCSLPPVDPTFIIPMFRVTLPAGYATLLGYHFQIFLPHDQGVISDRPVAPNGIRDKASILAQETRWICYAWPEQFGNNSRSCFVVDQDGEVLAASNVKPDGTPYYSGNQAPTYSAALDKRTHTDSLRWGKLARQNELHPDEKSYAIDGQVWRGPGS